jgi:uncharacterized protein
LLVSVLKFRIEIPAFHTGISMYYETMFDRSALYEEVQEALNRSPAVVLVGPRQVGKTTLARRFVAPDSPNYLDLEVPSVEAQLAAPMTALAGLRGLVVIDEVQRAPELFAVLRVLIDREPQADGQPLAQFLLLGSASPALLRQSSESLAGRVATIEAGGFTVQDIGLDTQTQAQTQAQTALWWRGGYPRSYTAKSDLASRQWRRDFMRLVVERDMPALGINIAGNTMQRFWAMLAHFHGQVWNAAAPAQTLGVNETTVRRYLDWLVQLFMLRTLQPWHENLGKRQVKAPKLYFRDTGLLHEQLGIDNAQALWRHPNAGASWEGFVVEQVLRIARPEAAYFWATHAGAELDLLLFKNGQRVGVEIKRTDAPKMTPSMTIALRDLRLDALYVVYPGSRRYWVAERVQAVPLTALLD